MQSWFFCCTHSVQVNLDCWQSNTTEGCMLFISTGSRVLCKPKIWLKYFFDFFHTFLNISMPHLGGVVCFGVWIGLIMCASVFLWWFFLFTKIMCLWTRPGWNIFCILFRLSYTNKNQKKSEKNTMECYATPWPLWR